MIRQQPRQGPVRPAATPEATHCGLVLLAAMLLVLVHRPERVMACTHSYGCWVAIALVLGVAVHQRWDAVRRAGGRAELSLADGPGPQHCRRQHGGGSMAEGSRWTCRKSSSLT